MSPAREPTPLVRKWRRAVAHVSGWFRERYYEGVATADASEGRPPLYPLLLADAERHARLLAAIHTLDLACAHERPKEIAATGEDLVREWKAVEEFMRHRPLLQSEAAE